MLAAGASRRLGRPKQLLPIDGEALVHRTCRIALQAGVQPVILVVGYQAEEVAAAVTDLDVLVCRHPRWADGVGSSIAAGATELPATATGVVILTCDQPALTSQVIRALLGAWQSGIDIVRCRYAASPDTAGPMGPPVLFSAGLFAQLRLLTGDQGARSVIEPYPRQRIATVPFPRGHHDIDTAADAAAWRQETHQEDRS